jgi:hypothetical protein
MRHPGLLVMEMHLVERGDEASLVPHRSQLGELKRCEGHQRLHGCERRVGLRGRAEDTWIVEPPI